MLDKYFLLNMQSSENKELIITIIIIYIVCRLHTFLCFTTLPSQQMIHIKCRISEIS